eukprot:968584-Rhodomonas_salina.1
MHTRGCIRYEKRVIRVGFGHSPPPPPSVVFGHSTTVASHCQDPTYRSGCKQFVKFEPQDLIANFRSSFPLALLAGSPAPISSPEVPSSGSLVITTKQNSSQSYEHVRREGGHKQGVKR